MSFKLEYPYTEQERLKFIVEYNHNKGCKIETINNFVEDVNYPTYYALELNEIMIDNIPVLDPEWEIKQEAKRQKEISMLSLTGADVERGIYKAKGMDFDDIIAYVSQLQPEGLDIKALKIELKANNFYRGNPYVDAVGSLLGFTKEQLDAFFETGDYTELLKENSDERADT